MYSLKNKNPVHNKVAPRRYGPADMFKGCYLWEFTRAVEYLYYPCRVDGRFKCIRNVYSISHLISSLTDFLFYIFFIVHDDKH